MNKDKSFLKGENKKIYNYSLFDILNIKRSTFFWKIVDILASRINKVGKLYEKIICKEYERESRLFNISNSDKILHIGCGAYPVTALSLSKNNGCKIVGIDKNVESVRYAKNLIKNRKLENKITISKGDGGSFSVKDFDTIIVSGCSVPKINILKNIFKNAKKGSKIIVREIYGANRLVLDMIDLNENIEIIKRIENHPFPTSRWESFYLVKK